MALILCGFRCAGKTTIGKQCANRLSLPFIDTDQLMERAFKKSVSEIYRLKGERYFRDLEVATIASLDEKMGVIATGGGTLLREENRCRLKKLGLSIYLKVPFPLLFERAKRRPFLFENLKERADHSFPTYETYCEYTFRADSPTIIDQICGFYTHSSSRMGIYE